MGIVFTIPLTWTFPPTICASDWKGICHAPEKAAHRMKKLAMVAVFISSFSMAFGQIEFKTNPVLVAFDAIPISLEKSFNGQLGLELDGLVYRYGPILYFTAKYYRNPKYGLDGLYFGAFTGYLKGWGSYGEDDGFGIGLLTGYKHLFSKNFLAEAALGAGADFAVRYPVLPYAKLMLGYRFN
jgi:hypothetical protein